MIHLIGDSHVNSFKGFFWKHYLGAVTLKRIGVDEDILSFVKKRWTCYFCFGEIDIRCHVKNWLHGKEIDTVISEWVNKYCDRLKTLGCKVGIVSVTPPTSKEFADTKEYPVSGTDDERILYTKRMNYYLKEKCLENGWKYIDTYTPHEVNGMLPREKSDGTVHIKKIKLKNIYKNT
jgi:hypothetical protein